MVSDFSVVSNAETLAMLRQLATDLHTTGKGRSDVFAVVCRANQQQAHPVSDGDLQALFGDLFGGSAGVGAAAKTTPATDPNFLPARSVHESFESIEESEGALKESGRVLSENGVGALLADSQRTRAPHLPGDQEPHEEKQRPAEWPSPELSLPEYVALAVDEQCTVGIWTCAADGPWRSPLWILIRLLRAHPSLANLAPKQAFQKVDRVLRSWRNRVPDDRRGDDWHHWLEISREDAEAEFISTWNKVKHLPGHSPLENALALARREPLELAEEKQESRPSGYARFVGLAGWLQVATGSQPIMLPVKELSGLLGVLPVTVSRYRRWAQQDGYLQEVREHQRPAKGQPGMATRFRFNIGLFPILRERAGEE